jgi:hypothetical protein
MMTTIANRDSFAQSPPIFVRAIFPTYAKSTAVLARADCRHTRGKFNGKPMICAANHKNPASYVSYNPPKHNAIVKKVGILRRIFDAILGAMHESRRRQAEREIANFVARRGGRVTDDYGVILPLHRTLPPGHVRVEPALPPPAASVMR